MATIQTTIKLQDGVTSTLNKISGVINKVTGAFTNMGNASAKAIDTPSIRRATSEIERLKTAILTKNGQIVNSEARIAAYEQQRAIINRKLDDIASKQAKTQAEIIAKTEREASLCVRLTSLKNKIASEEARISHLKDGIATRTDRIAQLENKIETEINQNTNAQNRFNQSLHNGSSAASNLWSKIKSFIGLYAGVQSVGGIVKTADELTMTTARLNLMTSGLKETKQLQDKIYQSAMRSRSSYLQTADAVAKLRLRAGQIFKTNDEAVAFSETLNKMFAIAGASQSEMYSATLQLTQALGSGVLRGEEFRAVFEAAPNVMQAVADYMNLPIGKLREIANEGQITADIVKNAMFKAASKVDEQFKTIPYTWSQVWTTVKNYTLKIFDPILIKIREIANSKRFVSFANAVGNAMAIVAGILTKIFDIIVSIVAFIHDNWSWIQAMLIGLVGVYLPAIVAWLWQKVVALIAAAGAWLIVNWQILLVAAAIALVIWVIMEVCDAFKTVWDVVDAVVGAICGVIAWAVATVWNIFVGLWNGILQGIDFVGNIIIGVVEWVLNACLGGFNSFGGACANLIGQICSWFLSLGKVVTTIIDAIFGTDWTGGLNSLQEKVLAWGKKDEKSITLQRDITTNALGLKRTSATDWYKKGYDFGSGGTGKISSWLDKLKGSYDSITNAVGKGSDFKGFDPSATDGLNDLGKALNKGFGNDNPALQDIVDNTDKIADNTSVDTSDEDLSYMRDLAEREAINKYTMSDVKIEMTNNNNVNSKFDLDDMVSYLQKKIYEGVVSTASGVHF